jgi:hypothetical protein
MRGRSFVERSLCLLVLFAAPWLCAQAPSREQFEDLSRRTQAALDSRPDEAIQLYKEALRPAVEDNPLAAQRAPPRGSDRRLKP